MPTTFGALMRQLRRARNLSLDETGKALNLSASYLSLIETGERPPLTSDRIEKLATVLKVPALVLIEAARGNAAANLENVAEPVSNWMPLDEREVALQRLDGLPRRIFGLAAAGLFKHDRNLRAHRKLSYADIEQEAERLRAKVFEYLGEHETLHDKPFPLTEFLDWLESCEAPARAPDERGAGICWQRADLPAAVEAVTRFDQVSNKFCLVISPETDRNLRKGGGRSRFTVGHEAAHLWLHQRELKEIASNTCTSSDPDVPAFESVEWQADAFSAALLAPAIGIQALLGDSVEAAKLEGAKELDIIGQVRDRFRISNQAAEKRWAVFKGRAGELLRAAKNSAK